MFVVRTAEMQLNIVADNAEDGDIIVLCRQRSLRIIGNQRVLSTIWTREIIADILNGKSKPI